LIPDGVIGIFIDMILPACNRKEYKGYFLDVKAAGA
jgi:hypothetical protein